MCQMIWCIVSGGPDSRLVAGPFILKSKDLAVIFAALAESDSQKPFGFARTIIVDTLTTAPKTDKTLI